jgi:hypothetical protein
MSSQSLEQRMVVEKNGRGVYDDVSRGFGR